ncbi:MAG: ABC transporter ATP-binding protein [Ginsengibacter sp.]
MHPLLHIKNLSLHFQQGKSQTVAVQDISITVNRGEIVAVVGESGSGKSVTALSILKLLPSPPAIYTNGEILFSVNEEGPVDLLRLNYSQLQKIRGKEIGMIFQEPMTSLNPVKQVGDQVQEVILIHQNVSKEIAAQNTIKLFRECGITEPGKIYKRYPHQISGGQKQRVMIAMAMSCNPALLIADEPTTALDVTVQKKILLLIKNLRGTHNMGVLYITHDLALVYEIADRIVVMNRGVIVEEGLTTSIFNHPKQPYTKALLACRPALYPKGTRLPVVEDFLNGNNITPFLKVRETLQATNENLISFNNIIEVKNVVVKYAGRRNLLGTVTQFNKAVDDVSFDVRQGETIGLVGESGCGKTTLGRAIAGLIKLSSGEITFRGQNIANIPAEEMRRLRKKIQVIFQDPYSSLNPRMSVGTAIEEPMMIHKIGNSENERRQKVMDLLSKVQLKPEHYNRYPHEFSGGQRQRICIARALALNPEFLICDESVSALDVSVQAQILNLLNDLKAEFNFSSIFISHDLAVVRYVSDRIIVMYNGKIIETGTADELYYHPQSNYTKALINALPQVKLAGL